MKRTTYHGTMNRGLSKVAEGTNLIVLCQMGKSRDTDTYSAEHGEKMMNKARLLFSKVMQGEAMHDLHGKGQASGTASGNGKNA